MDSNNFELSHIQTHALFIYFTIMAIKFFILIVTVSPLSMLSLSNKILPFDKKINLF